jgi:hypothetical protein
MFAYRCGAQFLRNKTAPFRRGRFTKFQTIGYLPFLVVFK